jgi:hypothetical protein
MVLLILAFQPFGSHAKVLAPSSATNMQFCRPTHLWSNNFTEYDPTVTILFYQRSSNTLYRYVQSAITTRQMNIANIVTWSQMAAEIDISRGRDGMD